MKVLVRRTLRVSLYHQTLATFLCHHILRKKGFIALVPGRVQALNSVPQWNKNLLSVIVVCELVGRGRDAVRLASDHDHQFKVIFDPKGL